MGTAVAAASRWGIVVVLARLGDAGMVGQVMLAVAICAPVAAVADLGLTVAQVTDAKREYRFGQYLGLRLVTALLAVLTVLGFLLYTLFSFRRRFIELGTLRAIGLSSGQMTLFLAWELAFLILVGIGVGTFLGSWMSNLFIPPLQVVTRPEDLTPPFLVNIAWPAIMRIYALFGILFVAALGTLVTLLLRMKIFQAIKLGETV